MRPCFKKTRKILALLLLVLRSAGWRGGEVLWLAMLIGTGMTLLPLVFLYPSHIPLFSCPQLSSW